MLEHEVVVGVIRDRRVHRYNSTLLLRMGKEPKGPFEELLLPPHCLFYYYCNYLFYLFYYKAASKETTVT
jgi:hypothetical protein